MGHNFIFDNWTPLSYKDAMASGRGGPYTAPTWVGREHERRLLAYKILRSYDDNSAREFRPEMPNRDRDEQREYGDAALLIDAVTSAVIGESQTITVAGAESYNPEAAVGAEVDEEARRSWEVQEWLKKWADSERLPIKMIETERNAVSLGDGVYTLGWSGKKGRPRLRVFDPGFYFPVLGDANEDDYPNTVHLAWEIDDDDLETEKRKVRRITWELRPTEDPRRHPWNDEPVNVTCYLSDGTWDWDPMERRAVDDFDPGKGVYAVNDEGDEIRDLDLQIDFIPVVHVPNTINLLEHYGKSSLMRILQILDDLVNADTDLQASSATTGNPVLALSGSTLGEERLTYRPGEILEVGDSGRLDALDTSKSLDALMKYVGGLLDRLSTNARLPAAILGRVDPSDVPSGIAIALSFGPLRAMIDQMRLVRKEKYPLLLKFAQRLAVAGGAEGAPDAWEKIDLEFGTFLPEDRGAAVREVTELLSADAISLETAVRVLQQAGFPIEDAVEEVANIQKRMFKRANDLLDATGDEAAVYEFLGREQPATSPRPEAPPVELPPRAEDEEA